MRLTTGRVGKRKMDSGRSSPLSGTGVGRAARRFAASFLSPGFSACLRAEILRAPSALSPERPQPGAGNARPVMRHEWLQPSRPTNTPNGQGQVPCLLSHSRGRVGVSRPSGQRPDWGWGCRGGPGPPLGFSLRHPCLTRDSGRPQQPASLPACASGPAGVWAGRDSPRSCCLSPGGLGRRGEGVVCRRHATGPTEAAFLEARATVNDGYGSKASKGGGGEGHEGPTLLRLPFQAGQAWGWGGGGGCVSRHPALEAACYSTLTA